MQPQTKWKQNPEQVQKKKNGRSDPAALVCDLMIGEERGPKPRFQKACARTACPDLFDALIAPRSLVEGGGERHSTHDPRR